MTWLSSFKLMTKVAVVNQKGLILGLKRSADDVARAGCWDLPGGNLEVEDFIDNAQKSGRGDADDILIISAVREVKEETGIQLNGESMRLVHAASGYAVEKQLPVVALGYAITIKNYPEIVLSHEHSAFGWFTKEEFMEVETGDDGGLIKDVVGKADNNQ